MFPTIGNPSAEKILLFTKTAPVAAIPSNCVHVPLRLGFGEEKKNYAASLAGKTSTQMVITVDGQSSVPQTVALAVVAPAIFNPGVLNQDYTVNSASQPAALGSVIQIFCTGLASTGSGAISARIAGQDIAKPYYGGPAPGIPGLQQVNLVIPANLPPGAVQVEVCAVATDPSQPVCSMPASVSVK